MTASVARPIEGRVHRLGDDIDADLLAPGLYMKGSLEALARHCLEALDPGFVDRLAPGDILVAGANFGIGSSREQAAQVLILNGVAAVVAVSFARLFYRNALNLGLPALTCPSAREIADGMRLRLDPVAGRAEEAESGRVHRCDPIPAHLMAMVVDGGLLPHLERKLARSRG